MFLALILLASFRLVHVSFSINTENVMLKLRLIMKKSRDSIFLFPRI